MKRSYFVATGLWTKKGDKMKFVKSINYKTNRYSTCDNPIDAIMFKTKDSALNLANYMKVHFPENFWTEFDF